MREQKLYIPLKGPFFSTPTRLRLSPQGLFLTPNSLPQNAASALRNLQITTANNVFGEIRDAQDFVTLALRNQGQAYQFLQNSGRVNEIFKDASTISDAIKAINDATPEDNGANIAASYLENKILSQFDFAPNEEASSSSDDDLFGPPKRQSPGAGR